MRRLKSLYVNLTFAAMAAPFGRPFQAALFYMILGKRPTETVQFTRLVRMGLGICSIFRSPGFAPAGPLFPAIFSRPGLAGPTPRLTLQAPTPAGTRPPQLASPRPRWGRRPGHPGTILQKLFVTIPTIFIALVLFVMFILITKFKIGTHWKTG